MSASSPPACVCEAAADVAAAAYGRPGVFGDPAPPLVGRVEEVNGPVLGSVVLCSPWGYEENSAFATLQLLARRLAESGLETLRFDYDGCGNSWGEAADPRRLACWVGSCA